LPFVIIYAYKIIITEQVLYDLANKHVRLSCVSKENDASCLSHFASKVAGGFCEYCCTRELCNGDWTIPRVADDCTDQSAAETVQHWPLSAGIFVVAVHAMLLHG